MFLNGAFLGLSYLEKLNQLPLASEYSEIHFYGKGIVDEIHVQDRLLTDEEILSLNIMDYPAWDGYTTLLSKFENGNFQAGNVQNLVAPVTNWLIYRKDTNDKIYKKIAEIDASETEYLDFTVQGNKAYTWAIFPKTVNQIGSPLETSQVITKFEDWYLVDQDTGTVYVFNLNMESGEISNETDYTMYPSYGKFNSFSWGDRDFLKGSIKALSGIIDVNGEYVNSLDYIEDLRAFINNKKDKLLKTPHSGIYKVITNNFKFKYLDDLSEGCAELGFDFIESGEVS